MLAERLKPVGRALYAHSPARVQEALLSSYFYFKSRRLHGATFDQQFDWLQHSQWYDPERLENLQVEKLQQIVAAASCTPYYKKLFQLHGISSRDIRYPQDLEKLPFLDKESLRSDAKQFVDPGANDTLVTLTSGTTGTPLRIYQRSDYDPVEEAFLERQYSWVGYKSNDRHVKMRGDLIVLAGQQSHAPWRFIRSMNELRMSSFHLSMDTLRAYVERIRALQPRALVAYPSSAALLAAFTKAHGLECHIPLVFLSSESLSASQRQLIEETFQAQVLEHYGQTEAVSAIQQCNFGSYHIIPEYGITELLPVEGSSDPELREIVATGFWNKAMPLLRYRTGDIVRITDHQSCPCGRNFPVVDGIIGREDDLLQTKTGGWVGRIHHVFFDLAGVIEAQVLQHKDASLTVRIVPGELFNCQVEAQVIQRLQDRLGALPVSIECVSQIARNASGKFRAVVSELSLDTIV